MPNIIVLLPFDQLGSPFLEFFIHDLIYLISIDESISKRKSRIGPPS